MKEYNRNGTVKTEPKYTWLGNLDAAEVFPMHLENLKILHEILIQHCSVLGKERYFKLVPESSWHGSFINNSTKCVRNFDILELIESFYSSTRIFSFAGFSDFVDEWVGKIDEEINQCMSFTPKEIDNLQSKQKFVLFRNMVKFSLLEYKDVVNGVEPKHSDLDTEDETDNLVTTLMRNFKEALAEIKSKAKPDEEEVPYVNDPLLDYRYITVREEDIDEYDKRINDYFDAGYVARGDIQYIDGHFLQVMFKK